MATTTVRTRQCWECDGAGSFVIGCADGVVFTDPCTVCKGTGRLPAVIYCATCNEPAGSEFSSFCCTADNMLTE